MVFGVFRRPGQRWYNAERASESKQPCCHSEPERQTKTCNDMVAFYIFYNTLQLFNLLRMSYTIMIDHVYVSIIQYPSISIEDSSSPLKTNANNSEQFWFNSEKFSVNFVLFLILLDRVKMCAQPSDGEQWVFTTCLSKMVNRWLEKGVPCSNKTITVFRWIVMICE